MRAYPWADNKGLYFGEITRERAIEGQEMRNLPVFPTPLVLTSPERRIAPFLINCFEEN